MKRSFKILLVLSLVLLFVSTVVFADIIKTDDAAEWAKKMGQGKTSFSFIVFGDNRGTSPGRKLPTVLDSMLRDMGYIHPDFIINTGDIMVGYTDTIEQAKEEIQAFVKKIYTHTPDVDFLFVPGNHEAPSLEISQLFTEYFGKKLYYDFVYGNSHFVMVNTTFPRKWLQKGQKYGFYNVNDGQHELAQIDWTKKVLNLEAAHTFIATHVPVFSALSPNFGKHPKSFTSKENRDEFLKLLVDKGIDAYFAGHEHVFYARKVNNSLFFTVGGGGAPLYGPTTGGYGVNKGEGPDYATTTFDPRFDHGGWAKGYHYDLHIPAGALSIFSYMLVTVDGDKVSYDLLVPQSFDVTYLEGNDGVSLVSSAEVANRTPYTRTLKGVTFFMPYSKDGYEVEGTQINWARKVSPAKKQPEILEVKRINNYFAKVRVAVEVPAAYSITVTVRAR